MRVKRLKMTSFRGIDDLTLEFNLDSSTVFIGINGVGKSSILDCLAILLSGFQNLIQFDPEVDHEFSSYRQPFDGLDFSTEDIKNNHQKTKCEVSFSINNEDDITWTFQENRVKMPRVIVVGKRYRRDFSGQDEPEKFKQQLDRLENITDKIRHQWQQNSEASIPLVVYYPVNRWVEEIDLDIKDQYSFSQVEAYLEALEGVKISFETFFKWFRAIEDLEAEEKRDNPDYIDPQLEAVRHSIYSVLGEEYRDVRVRRKPLRMTIKKESEELIVNQLSEGEKSLLALTGDLARRLALANPALSNPLEGSAVVLIDEIEQHLHPEWQRRIMPVLTTTFPNCQFIVTTHSPQVISQIKPESIYILKKQDERIIALHPESSYGRDSNRILEDLMGVPERPLKNKQDLLELFRLIDQGNLEEAKQLRRKIADEIGEDEPELVKAGVSIRRREILQR